MSHIVEKDGELFVAFDQEELARAKKYGFTAEGVAYYEDYYYSGCHFTLMREETTTDEQLKAAERYLRQNRDVVGISIGLVEKETISNE